MPTSVGFWISRWWSSRFLRHGSNIQPCRADLLGRDVRRVENHTEPRKSAELLMESVIFQCGSFLEPWLISRARQKDPHRWDSPFWAGDVALAARRVFMELKIEKLFGESQLPREEMAAHFTPRPISDCSVVFVALSGVLLRRRESAISFSEIRRDFFTRISFSLRFWRHFSFFSGKLFYFCMKMKIIRAKWSDG